MSEARNDPTAPGKMTFALCSIYQPQPLFQSFCVRTKGGVDNGLRSTGISRVLKAMKLKTSTASLPGTEREYFPSASAVVPTDFP